MKKFLFFLVMLTFGFLLNATYHVDSLGKQAAQTFVQQEYFTFEQMLEWVKDPQNTYIDTINVDIKQALARALVRKFGAGLDLLFPRVLVGHTDAVITVAFSKNGKYIITGSRDKTAKIWQASTGMLLSTLYDTAEITALALSDDENLLVTASTDIKIWCFKTRELKSIVSGCKNIIHAIKISADNRYLYITYKNKAKEIWDLTTGLCISCDQRPDESVTVTLHLHNKIAVHDNIKDRVIDIFRVNRKYSYSCGSSTLVEESCSSYGARGCSVYAQLPPDDNDRSTITETLWSEVEFDDTGTGKVHILPDGHTDYITAVALCPHKNLVVTGSNDKYVKVWDLVSEKHNTLVGCNSPVRAVAVSSDGRQIAAALDNATVRIWDLGYLTGHIDFDILITFLRNFS